MFPREEGNLPGEEAWKTLSKQMTCIQGQKNCRIHPSFGWGNYTPAHSYLILEAASTTPKLNPSPRFHDQPVTSQVLHGYKEPAKLHDLSMARRTPFIFSSVFPPSHLNVTGSAFSNRPASSFASTVELFQPAAIIPPTYASVRPFVPSRALSDEPILRVHVVASNGGTWDYPQLVAALTCV